MTCWQDRIALAQSGWHTELRITNQGARSAPDSEVYFGVWAKRGYWNGSLADVCLFETATIDLASGDPHAAMSRIAANVRDMCDRAMRDFKQGPPCMSQKHDAQGRTILVASQMGANGHSDEGLHPTEKLPHDIALSARPGGPDHLSALIRAGQAGLHVEDAMNTYHGYPRFARECKDRDWGYRLRLAQRQLGDIKIAFSPTTFCVESLHEDHIYGLIDGATFATQALFARFAANGDASSQAQTGLPPGFSRR